MPPFSKDKKSAAPAVGTALFFVMRLFKIVMEFNRTVRFKGQPTTGTIDEIILAHYFRTIIQHRFATVDVFVTNNTCYPCIQRDILTGITQ